jgi:NAD-dependent deacetylase
MKIVVFTGAGISRESGIATFRDSDGLWAQYRIEDVCTPEALARNREGVIDFYNMRRREVLSKEPNAALRRGQYGSFYGCAGYPNCRYTLNR